MIECSSVQPPAEPHLHTWHSCKNPQQHPLHIYTSLEAKKLFFLQFGHFLRCTIPLNNYSSFKLQVLHAVWKDLREPSTCCADFWSFILDSTCNLEQKARLTKFGWKLVFLIESCLAFVILQSIMDHHLHFATLAYNIVRSFL